MIELSQHYLNKKEKEQCMSNNNTTKYKQSLLFIMIVTVVSSMVNLSTFICSSGLSNFNIMATTLFLVSWFLFGLINGIFKNSLSIIFTITYWGLAIIMHIYTSIAINPLIPLLIFAYLNTSSLYALVHFLEINELKYFALILLIPMILSISGYVVGKKYSQNSKNQL